MPRPRGKLMPMAVALRGRVHGDGHGRRANSRHCHRSSRRATRRCCSSSGRKTLTDMTSGFDVPKNDPRQVARQIADGIEREDAEVLADDQTRYVKAALPGPVEALRAG